MDKGQDLRSQKETRAYIVTTGIADHVITAAENEKPEFDTVNVNK